MLEALAAHSEDWGGEWQPRDAGRPNSGGKLTLPVAAGLRRGVIEGQVAVSASGSGTELTLEVSQAAYQLNWQPVAILAFGAAGSLLLVLWPFFPRLLELAPIGAIAAFASWFLVASRLRTSSPQDYLDALAVALGGDR